MQRGALRRVRAHACADVYMQTQAGSSCCLSHPHQPLPSLPLRPTPVSSASAPSVHPQPSRPRTAFFFLPVFFRAFNSEASKYQGPSSVSLCRASRRPLGRYGSGASSANISTGSRRLNLSPSSLPYLSQLLFFPLFHPLPASLPFEFCKREAKLSLGATGKRQLAIRAKIV